MRKKKLKNELQKISINFERIKWKRKRYKIQFVNEKDYKIKIEIKPSNVYVTGKT